MADSLARGAEVIHVIQADAGDDGAIGVKGIHRIQAPTQTDFEHQYIDGAAQEQVHCGEGSEFEIGQPGIAALFGSGRLHPREC